MTGVHDTHTAAPRCAERPNVAGGPRGAEGRPGGRPSHGGSRAPAPGREAADERRWRGHWHL